MRTGGLLKPSSDVGPARIDVWAAFLPQGVFVAENPDDVPTSHYVVPRTIVIFLGMNLEMEGEMVYHLVRVGGHVGWIKVDAAQVSFM